MTYNQVRGDFVIASSCGVKINFKNQYYVLSLGLGNIGFSKSTYFSDNFYSSKGIKTDLSRMQVGIEASTTGCLGAQITKLKILIIFTII